MDGLPTSFAAEKGRTEAHFVPGSGSGTGCRGETRDMRACVERNPTSRGETRGYSTPDGLITRVSPRVDAIRTREGSIARFSPQISVIRSVRGDE